MQIENVKSCFHPVSCGIPQGSVLGPDLFNILINDTPKATSKFNVIMYADNTTLVSHLENFGPVNDTNTLEQALNKEISKVNTWLLSNKLLLNVAKSRFMIFFKHPRRWCAVKQPIYLSIYLSSILEQYQNSTYQSMAIK